MTRRQFALSTLVFSVPGFAEGNTAVLQGRLTQSEGQPSTLAIDGGKTVTLEGDAPTDGVLHDARLKGMTFEVTGSYTSPGVFRIEPIHKRAMFVLRDGKKLFVTYWCAVCSIRTYTPGICYCCQDETALDLRDKFD